MYTITHYILWLLTIIAGVVFGIFLASSLGLHNLLYVFLLAGFFGIIFAVISYKLTEIFINRISGRKTYLLAGIIILAAIMAAAFMLIEAYL